MKNLIIISAPSGSGKTTLCRALEKKDPEIQFSVSCTTRPIRHNEVDGRDYHFITNEEFENKIKENEFAEWEEIHGNFFYGTLKSVLNDAIARKRVLLLELDVQGAMSVKKLYPDSSLSIFVLPPSLDDLRKRLIRRGTDTEDRIAKRLARLQHELGYKKKFDRHIINDDVDRAVNEIIEIINHENEGVLYGT